MKTIKEQMQEIDEFGNNQAELLRHAKFQLRAIKDLQEENHRLREGLLFYAAKKHIGKDCHHYPIVKDEGEVAREALRSKPQPVINGWDYGEEV